MKNEKTVKINPNRDRSTTELPRLTSSYKSVQPGKTIRIELELTGEQHVYMDNYARHHNIDHATALHEIWATAWDILMSAARHNQDDIPIYIGSVEDGCE